MGVLVEVEAVVSALHGVVCALEPECLSGDDAARLVEVFARAEKVAGAGKALAARRVAPSGPGGGAARPTPRRGSSAPAAPPPAAPPATPRRPGGPPAPPPASPPTQVRGCWPRWRPSRPRPSRPPAGPAAANRTRRTG